MVSEEDLKRDNMFYEAGDRLKLMKVAECDRQELLLGREITKVFVNHEAHSVRRDEITDEEMQLIRNLEAEKNIIVYYMIQDEGLWPDGCTFPRYTFLHVDEYVNDYQMVKDECIGRCGTIPAYVMNLEEPECSELAEIKFMNVNGLIINAS